MQNLSFFQWTVKLDMLYVFWLNQLTVRLSADEGKKVVYMQDACSLAIPDDVM